MIKLFDWLDIKYQQFQMWRESWKPCYKEKMGYTCRHEILSGGIKECGDE